MEYIYIIFIALSIALVAYSAAFWGGVYRCLCVQEIIKMAIAFSLFQLGMFWLGNWSGNNFARSMGWLSIPFAEAVILLTGAKLSIFAFSRNAFMLGLGIGLLKPVSDLMLYSILLGVAGFAVLGNFMGKKSGKIFYTKYASILSGMTMITLAVLLALDFYDVF